GPARPVVIKEPGSGRIQLLPEVQGKGKEKVAEEQVAHDLLTIQTPKPKNPTYQFIFQRRTPMPTEPSEHADSPSLDAELALIDSETKSTLVNKTKARLDQTLVMLQSLNLNQEQIDDEFTTTAYPNVQENLKLLTKDQFFVEKPQEEEPGKTNVKAEVQSMVSVPIHQDTSLVPPMNTLDIDLTKSQSDSPLPTSTATTLTITTTTTLPPPPPLQSTTDLILVRRIGELEQHIADLIQNKLAPKERLDKHGSRMYKLENLNIPHQVSKAVDDILPPPPPLPSTGTSRYAQQQGSQALSSSKTASSAPQFMSWTTSDIQYESADIPGAQDLSPTDYLMHDDSIPKEQVHLSNDEDSENDH
ncbi:hypothetical protein Tco_0904323, partial [Tanacetum coccineum]